MRALRRALAAAGWLLLGLVAATGVALSVAALAAAVPGARRAVAGLVVRQVDEAVAGRLAVEGIAVLPNGGLEIRELRVYDPHDHLVLAAGRVRLWVDATALSARVVGLTVEVEDPTVLVEEEEGGGISLARAFAPTRPTPRADAATDLDDPLGGWTLQLSRLTLRNGALWWVDVKGKTRAEASALDLAARGSLGPREARLELSLRGEAREPVAAPLSVEVVATRQGDVVRLPRLAVEAGGTSLAAVGEGDLARATGRVAVTRLGLSRAQARALVPEAPAGADLAGVAFAEADGHTVTAALRVEPEGGGTTGAAGRGDAAVAFRQDGPGRAAGLDVALTRLDPSRLADLAPAGEVTLTARGAFAGTGLDDGVGRLVLAVAPSRLRGGTVDRLEVTARAARGAVEVERFAAAAPGLAVSGAGRWRPSGPVSGTAQVEAADLAAAARNLARLSATPLPALSGRARLAATLEGTADAPALSGTLEVPALRAGAVAVDGARLAVAARGPLAAAEASADGKVAEVRSGGEVVARQIALRASLARGGDASLDATAAVPAAGDEPLAVSARGKLDDRRASLRLADLVLAWPGTRLALAQPATVAFAGPTVDRLELASGTQRLAVEGGLGPGGALAAKVEAVRLDLARLPAGLLPLPPGEALAGELTATVEASGTTARPDLRGRASFARGTVHGWDGLGAEVEGRWDGAARRASAKATLSRDAGGRVEAEVELPVPLAGRAAEALSVKVRGAALPVAEALLAAGVDLPADGKVTLDLRLDGTVGAPALSAEAALTEGVYDDLDGLALTLRAEGPGKVLHATAAAALAGRPAATAEVSLPVDLAALLARPGEVAKGLPRAPLAAALGLTRLDLAALSGRLTVPPGLAGSLSATVTVTGTAEAPRAVGEAALESGAAKGWRGLGAQVAAAATAEGLRASGRLSTGGDAAVVFDASLGLAPERLPDRAALLAAPLRVDARVPALALAKVGGPLALAGTLDGQVAVRGTLRAPEVTGEVQGGGVAVEGRPLGEVRAALRYASRRGSGEASLRPASGGAVRATLAVDADLGLGAPAAPLGEAPAEARLWAEALDLGALPALAPGVVRSASGKLDADLAAKGPLAGLRPEGKLTVKGARLAVTEYGEWTDVAVEATFTRDAVDLALLEVKRGKGKLTARAALRGLAGERATLQGAAAAEAFTVARAGMDLATLDLAADLGGSYVPGRLTVDVTVPKGTVRLPRKTPRALQGLEPRKDIVVGERREKKRHATAAAAAEAAGARALTVVFHFVSPRNLFVKSESPKLDVELKADVRTEVVDGQPFVEGNVEAVRGAVEPIAGRNFVLDHGKVQFTGGPPMAALLDVQARYQNPAADVTVMVAGTAAAPEIRLSSRPPMDDGQIAMLIATGRTELKAGSGAVGAVTGEEAGRAALGALATQAFRNIVQDKLPLDTVSVDSASIRAGKYVTDRIYVGYQRRFDADPTRNENADEVRVEYQITPRWNFESRYGNAQSGGASLIWSKDY